MEFVKEPLDIDEAVNDVINFRETRRRPDPTNSNRKNKHTARSTASVDSDEEERIARLPGRPSKGNSFNKTTASSSSPTQGKSIQQVDSEVNQVKAELQQLKQRVEHLENQRQQPRQRQNNQRQPFTSQRNGSSNSSENQAGVECFKCGQRGHYA